MIEVGVCRIGAIVWHSGVGPGLIAAVRGREPIEAVRKMLANGKPQALFASGLLEHADDVLSRPRCGGVPTRVVDRFPEIEIIMMHAHAAKVLRASLLVELHQMIGIELLRLPGRDYVLEAEFRRMSVGLD